MTGIIHGDPHSQSNHYIDGFFFFMKRCRGSKGIMQVSKRKKGKKEEQSK